MHVARWARSSDVFLGRTFGGMELGGCVERIPRAGEHPVRPQHVEVQVQPQRRVEPLRERDAPDARLLDAAPSCAPLVERRHGPKGGRKRVVSPDSCGPDNFREGGLCYLSRENLSDFANSLHGRGHVKVVPSQRLHQAEKTSILAPGRS